MRLLGPSRRALAGDSQEVVQRSTWREQRAGQAAASCGMRLRDAQARLDTVEPIHFFIQAGTPLTDADRQPWLERLVAVVQRHAAARQPAVLSCSALKPSYRALLRTGISGGDDAHAGAKDAAGAMAFVSVAAGWVATWQPANPACPA